jgi:hypothetical protein
MGHSFIPRGSALPVEDGCKTRKKQFRQLLRNEYGPQVHADSPIGQKQRRPMDGAQFHSPWAGFAGGGLKSGPASGDQLDYQHDQCDHQQNVNESTQRVGTDYSEQPQNEQD